MAMREGQKSGTSFQVKKKHYTFFLKNILHHRTLRPAHFFEPPAYCPRFPNQTPDPSPYPSPTPGGPFPNHPIKPALKLYQSRNILASTHCVHTTLSLFPPRCCIPTDMRYRHTTLFIFASISPLLLSVRPSCRCGNTNRHVNRSYAFPPAPCF